MSVRTVPCRSWCVVRPWAQVTLRAAGCDCRCCSPRCSLQHRANASAEKSAVWICAAARRAALAGPGRAVRAAVSRRRNIRNVANIPAPAPASARTAHPGRWCRCQHGRGAGVHSVHLHSVQCHHIIILAWSTQCQATLPRRVLSW